MTKKQNQLGKNRIWLAAYDARGLMEEKEIRLQGYAVSEGIAIGVSFFICEREEELPPEFPISLHEVDGEIDRYRKALFCSREDLRKLQSDLATEKMKSSPSREGYVDAMKIIDTHIQMLDDPLMTTDMEDKIRLMKQNTESVFWCVIRDYKKRFTETKDSFFKERWIDVLDLSRRILGHLYSREKASFKELPNHAIVFTREINPSEAASMIGSQVTGFVTESGGGNSHAALIARAKGIPFVVGIDHLLLQSLMGKSVIVDGLKGELIVNPSRATLLTYRKFKEKSERRRQEMEREIHLPSETSDGHLIQLYANVGSLNEVDEMHRLDMPGIGLYRSEFLILEHPGLIYSEEQQYQHYRELFHRTKELPVVFRAFDIGGDKHPELYLEVGREPQTLLGYRGIQFLLCFKTLFKIQLRALLRASDEKEIFLLLPLLSEIEELRQAKQIIEEVREELQRKNRVFIGCMIELPSTVFIIDLLAKESDFFSLGTNDLVQHALGVHRTSPLVSDFSFPAHPSIIRIIKKVIQEAKAALRPISICGELANNPLFLPLLIGLGIDEVSIAPRHLPEIKRLIRRCSLEDARKLAMEVEALDSLPKVAQRLISEYYRLLPEEEERSCKLLV